MLMLSKDGIFLLQLLVGLLELLVLILQKLVLKVKFKALLIVVDKVVIIAINYILAWILIHVTGKQVLVGV